MNSKNTNNKPVIKPFSHANEKIVLYSWSKKTGFNDAKDQNLFTRLDTLYKKLQICKGDEVKIKKFVEKDENQEIWIAIDADIKAVGFSGNVAFVKTNNSKQSKYDSYYGKTTFRLADNAMSLAYSKYDAKTFSITADTTFIGSAQFISEAEQVNRTIAAMVLDYNKVIEVFKGQPLEFKELINSVENKMYIGIGMESKKDKDAGEKDKPKLTGYPWFKEAKDFTKIWNEDGDFVLTKTVEINGRSIEIPTDDEDVETMDRDLFHSDVLHEQFGKGTLFKSSFKYQWSLSKNIVALKVVLAGNDVCMAPKIPDNSCSGDALSELKLKQKELLGNNQFKTLQIQSDADKNIIDDHPEDDQ